MKHAIMIIQQPIHLAWQCDVNDVNSPVQTQESEMGEAELQVDANRVDAEEKSDESSTNVAASFSCEECGKTFATTRAETAHTGSLNK